MIKKNENHAGELDIKCIHKKNQRPIQKFVKDIKEYLEKRLETEKKLNELIETK